MIEIATEEGLRAWMAHPGAEPVAIQSLALDGRLVAELLTVPLRSVYFLGCDVAPADLGLLAAAGAAVFSKFDGLPFDPYRGDLYSPAELFAGFDAADPCSYCETPDARIYRYWADTGRARARSIVDALARRLHDHAITDALADFLSVGERAEKVVAVMGGHDLLRTDPMYRELASLSRTLTRDGFLMISGGGPGAMEATHLGAALANGPDHRLDAAIAVLGGAPRFDDRQFVAAAFAAAAANRDLAPGISLSIPTWLYGHEPPTIFATHVAKYFDNSVREDGLVSVARRGIVFAPGGAGTVQELFQDAAQNQYFAMGEASPMVLLGTDFWQHALPAWPLLDAMRAGTDWGSLVSIVDSAADAVAHLQRCRPLPATVEPWSFCTAQCGQPAVRRSPPLART
ncbi:MAG: LOG family protein [Acidimicrobiia bacterium]